MELFLFDLAENEAGGNRKPIECHRILGYDRDPSYSNDVAPGFVRHQVTFLPEAAPVRFTVIFVSQNYRHLLFGQFECAIGFNVVGGTHDQDMGRLTVLVPCGESEGWERRAVDEFH